MSTAKKLMVHSSEDTRREVVQVLIKRMVIIGLGYVGLPLAIEFF